MPERRARGGRYRAQLRGEVERDMAQIAALIAEANTRVAAATRSRTPRRVLEGARKDLAAVDESVQKAGAAMRADDYLAARTALQGVKEKIEQGDAGAAAARSAIFATWRLGEVRSSFKHHVGPAGQIDPLFAPFDALGATGSNHVHLARGAAVGGRGHR
jgi:hypothetical protein